MADQDKMLEAGLRLIALHNIVSESGDVEEALQGLSSFEFMENFNDNVAKVSHVMQAMYQQGIDLSLVVAGIIKEMVEEDLKILGEAAYE
jgi:hypothetical protein